MLFLRRSSVAHRSARECHGEPSLKLQASLVNGWNNDPDNNIGKTFGANATFAPPDSGLNASLTTYIGKETTAGSGGNTRILIDGVVTKDIAQASVGLNVDYLKDGTPYWIGAAAMGKYAFTDMFNLAARFELISSKQNAFTVAFPRPRAQRSTRVTRSFTKAP